MAIEDWMPTLKAKLAEVSGVRQVHNYDELPGSLHTFPCMIILPVSGDQVYSAGGPDIAHHRVQVTLYVAAQVLPEAYGLAVPFIALVRNKLAANVKLGNTVVQCAPVQPPEAWYDGPGQLNYADKTHIGIIFRLDVEEHETVTVSA